MQKTAIVQAVVMASLWIAKFKPKGCSVCRIKNTQSVTNDVIIHFSFVLGKCNGSLKNLLIFFIWMSSDENEKYASFYRTGFDSKRFHVIKYVLVFAYRVCTSTYEYKITKIKLHCK